MKVCLIEQSAGLGDILFTLKIGAHYANEGYRVIWPVQPVYANLNKYIKVEGIEFPCVHDVYDVKAQYERLKKTQISDVTEIDGLLYVPLRRGFFSDFGINMRKTLDHEESNMLSKFGMCSLEHYGWSDYFDINRNYQKEEELSNRLGHDEADKIHLVNHRFGTPPRWHETLKKEIITPSGLKRAEMCILEGFNLFDWCGVMERAQKVDTVATSLVFLFEKISLNCVPTIHSRNKKMPAAANDFELMKKIYSKEYVYEA
tara:strand:+ start:11842 stop:12618 length:777 start_codon:yes stop_codon:yes gene_type:complete